VPKAGGVHLAETSKTDTAKWGSRPVDEFKTGIQRVSSKDTSLDQGGTVRRNKKKLT